MKGIVYKSTGSWYSVKDDSGNFYDCRIKGRFRIQGIKSTNPVAVGDRVIFELEETGDHQPQGEREGPDEAEEGRQVRGGGRHDGLRLPRRVRGGRRRLPRGRRPDRIRPDHVVPGGDHRRVESLGNGVARGDVPLETVRLELLAAEAARLLALACLDGENGVPGERRRRRARGGFGRLSRDRGRFGRQLGNLLLGGVLR